MVLLVECYQLTLPFLMLAEFNRTCWFLYGKRVSKWITSQALAQPRMISECLDNWVISEAAAQISSDPWK